MPTRPETYLTEMNRATSSTNIISSTGDPTRREEPGEKKTNYLKKPQRAPCLHLRMTPNVPEIIKSHGDDDIHASAKRSAKWQMTFIFGKCKCLNTVPEQRDTGMNYATGGIILSSNVNEKKWHMTTVSAYDEISFVK